MNGKKTLCIFLLLFTSLLLFSEQLIYKYKKGQKYKIITNVFEKVYFDGKFSHTAEFSNKAAIEYIEVKDNKGNVSALFQVFGKSQSSNQIKKLSEEHKVSYWIDTQGRYEINLNFLFPLTRDIPFFPNKDISPGDTWEAEGKEIHDFTPYDIQMPINIPVIVNYKYVKNEIIGETRVAKLKINYEIYQELPELLKIPGKHPLLIYGKVEQFFFWDIDNGRYHSYEDNFDIIYVFNDNHLVEFVGTSQGEVIESPGMDKEKIKEEIEKTIKDEDMKDTSVSTDDEGVTITLNNINFKPESDILMPTEQDKLKKIARILKKYPDRDIFIAGHTALAGDEKGREILSDKRAKAVGDYLIYLGIKNNMIFVGYGARFPIADNSTENGMKKNRRVEIKILEN